MGLITKKQVRRLRLWVLSNKLEQALLLMYILCFVAILVAKSGTQDGTALRGNGVHLTSYQFLKDLREYFLQNEVVSIGSVDELYNYLEKLQNERLWVAPGRRSPYWPLGATRVVQYRVNSTEHCSAAPEVAQLRGVKVIKPSEVQQGCHGTFQNNTNQNEVLRCLRRVYSTQCNQLFQPGLTEHGFRESGGEKKPEDVVYTPFVPKDRSLCATGKECREFAWNKNTLNQGFIGRNGVYPPGRGYRIDFDSDRAANTKKIEQLKKTSWIDQDTAAIQITWNVHSSWSQTYYSL